MRPGFLTGRWAAALIATLVMLLAAPAAPAFGDAQVRFVQAVPGAEALQLEVRYAKGGQQVGGPVEFAQVGTYVSLPKGQATFELSNPPEAGRPSVEQRLKDGGRYTAVAVGGGDVTLRLLSDGPARPGGARLRAVHVAPELGGVEVRLGDQPMAQLDQFKDVADYATVDPGAYAVRITRPGDGSTLAAQGGVPLTAGTASTAFVLGTGGEPLQVVVAADRSATPTGAPQTGLGGLSDDGPSLLTVLLVGLFGAAAGGLGYLTLTGRSRGRGI